MKGRTDVRTYVDDVMAIKPNFLTSMGYHIFLTMVLRARAPSARAELRYNELTAKLWFVRVCSQKVCPDLLGLISSVTQTWTFTIACDAKSQKIPRVGIAWKGFPRTLVLHRCYIVFCRPKVITSNGVENVCVRQHRESRFVDLTVK